MFAGIPRIMQAMFEGIVDTLEGGAPVLSRAVTAAVPEGILGGPLADIQKRFPRRRDRQLSLQSRWPAGASLVARGTERPRLEEAAAAIRRMVRDLGVETHRRAILA